MRRSERPFFELRAVWAIRRTRRGRNLRTRKSEMIGLLFYPSCAQIFKNPFYAEIMKDSRND